MHTLKQFEPILYIFAIIALLLIVHNSAAQAGGNAIDLYNENYLLHGDFIDAGSPNYGFTDKVTVCAWVKWNVNPQTYINNHNELEGKNADIVTIDKHTVKDNGQFWLQHTNSNANFQWSVQTASSKRSITSSTSPVNNAWYYVVGVYDDADPSNSLKIYVNGILESTDNNLTGNINSYNSLYRLNIGRLPSGYRLFAGELDEIRIYKRALSQQEIRTQMFSAVTVDTSSLVSYWDFNQSSGANITDKGSMNLNTTFYSSLVDVHDTTSVPVYSIYDNDKDWAVNGWAGKQIVTIAGDGVGETNTVVSNSAFILVLQNPWITKPRLDDFGAGTGMTWYGIIDPSETTQWKISTASIGKSAIFINTQNATTTGSSGALMQVTITSTPSVSNNLVAYIYGSAIGEPVSTGETFPAGIDKRSNIVWGIYEWGSVTAGFTINFSGVAGIGNVSELKLLRKSRFSTSWSEVTTAVLDPNNMTFTLSGITSYYEYSLGGNNNNPLPVKLAEFTGSSFDNNAFINWKTYSELNNKGFDIERYTFSESTIQQWKKIAYVEGNGTTNDEHSYSFSDNGLNKGKYSYRLKQIDYNGNFEYFYLTGSINIKTPETSEIFQNYPNPSNPVSKIDFRLSVNSNVSLIVYDISGKEIKVLVNGELESGYHTAEFDGNDIASGIYFYRFIVKSENYYYSAVKRLILLK